MNVDPAEIVLSRRVAVLESGLGPEVADDVFCRVHQQLLQPPFLRPPAIFREQLL